MLVNNLVELIEYDDMVCKVAKQNNGWFEPGTFEFIMNHVDDYTTFLDCGAYTGLYTIAVHMVTSNVSIFAFEPNPSIMGQLIQNIGNTFVEGKDASIITISDMALSDKKGVANLVAKDVKFLTSAGSIEPTEEIDHTKSKVNTVDTVDFDSYYRYWIDNALLDESSLQENYTAKLDKNGVSCAKIDVEGHELSVLKGMSNILIRDKPALAIESLDDNHSKQIKDYLNMFGYKYLDTVDGRNMLFV